MPRLRVLWLPATGCLWTAESVMGDVWAVGNRFTDLIASNPTAPRRLGARWWSCAGAGAGIRRDLSG